MKAVIYCRVSTDRQATEGHGLEGQERRCRQYAKQKGYEVLKVFFEEGVSGGITERPEMQKLLTFLQAQGKKKSEKIVVIIDDIKRLARDIQGHFQLKAAIVGVNGVLESPSHKFEDTPEGKFIETIMASAAELERNQNKMQVKNRMKARLESGYWTFYAPPGYENSRDAKLGKIVTRKEPEASIITEALESFSTGKLHTQKDVQRFLKSRGYEGRASIVRSGKVHLQAVKRLLENDFYAGLITCEDLGVYRVKGAHESLISVETYNRIQDRLQDKVRSHVRQDMREDFPLRGSVACELCGRLLTASWTTGRTGKKFPYYRCLTQHCTGSIPKQRLEDEFYTLLRKYKPRKKMIALFEMVLRDVQSIREDVQLRFMINLQKELESINKQLGEVREMALKTKKDAVREMYEDQLEELLAKRKQLQEGSIDKNISLSEYHFEIAFAKGKHLLLNPLETWERGLVKQKLMIQNLVYRGKLSYGNKSGFGNSEYSLLYKVFSDTECSKSHLVEVGGIEPPSGKGRS